VTDLDHWYEILELEPGASFEEVKQAYRDLARIWHPDRFGGDPRLRQRAEARQKEINEAFRQLKAHADELGRVPRPTPPPPPSHGASTEPRPQTFQPPLTKKRDPARDTWTIRPALGLEDRAPQPSRSASRARLRLFGVGLLLVVLVLVWFVLR
jgi:DnaJ domain